MPITQERLATLLEEHEDVLTRALNAKSMLLQIIAMDDSLAWSARKELLLNACATLANLPDKWAVVERERLKARWSRNIRLKKKMEAKRRVRGIAPRQSTATVTRTQREIDLASDAEYEAWNRGEIE